MATYGLVSHPDTPPAAVRGVTVDVRADAGGLQLEFSVAGKDAVRIPDPTPATRADGLWKTTCCELFLAPAGSDAYFEFNYAPSTQWAAYRFDSYRTGGCDLALSFEPQVVGGTSAADALVTVSQILSDLPPGPLQINLSAVIEETNGTKSYWALAHAPGPPDFHNRDCFIATLPAPTGA
ncbi:hypothetical protein ABIC16_001794 [Sphingomonas sp. PvP055]|uniref:DOMON-like domain-containing protein n=1 Tax=Sphingomonas sp. PvP055 TaxID=3156391 RepID=UPI003396E2B5